MNKRLIIFTKLPHAGKVKTRLIPALGADNAAELYRRLLVHTLRIQTAQDNYEVELCCASDKGHALFKGLKQEYACSLSLQQGDDLGMRMYHACQQALAECEQVIVIGCDCPLLTAEAVAKGFDRLQQGDDLVLAKAKDGGYVMIGLSMAHKELFVDIDWGSNKVYRQTLAQADNLGLKHTNIATYWDIDDPQDLQRLKQHVELLHLIEGFNL